MIEDHLGKHDDWGKFFIAAGLIATVTAIGCFVNYEKLPFSREETNARDKARKADSDAEIRVDTPQPLVQEAIKDVIVKP